jgi:tRNA(Ile)-lysidine synthase
MRWFSGAEYAPRHTAMLEMEAALGEAQKHTLSGCLLTREDADLRITREYNAVRAATCPTTEVWDGRWQLDGPHATDLHIAALGAAVKDCPDWRETGLPRASLMASPAVWREDTLIAAPLAGHNPAWTARIVTSFASSLLSH